MRRKSEELMARICEFAEEYRFCHRRSPSTQTVANALGVAKSTVYKYLVELNARGVIEYDGDEIETSRTKKLGGSTVTVPIIGSIVCGEPEFAEENFEEYVSLPTSLFGKGEFFILRTHGDSMIGAGIEDGDMVVVKKQGTANSGEIVVALVEGETTLKTLRFDKDGRVVLHPENDEMEDILPKECFIQGVAKHVIKSL